MNLDYQKQCIENYFEGIYVPDGTFIAGGCILSIMTGQPVNDVDMYFSSREAVAEFIQTNDNVYLHSVTDKSISLSLQTSKYGTKEFQLIYFDSYKNADEIFSDFDFTVCMCAYSFDDKQFYFHDDFWKDVAAKKLKFNSGTKFPIISMLRVNKYQKKGYEISNSELRKIALAISKLNLEDKETFLHQYGSMYGLESTVDLFLEDNDKFNPEVALEKFVTEYQEPILIFNTKNNIRKVIDKPTPYIVEWMVDYLLKTGSYNDFTQQPFYVEVEGSGKDKKYKLFGIENKEIVDSIYDRDSGKRWDYTSVSSDYAQAHILLYKDMYDPLLKSLNSMIKQGQGFNSAKENKDYDPF